MGSSSKTTSSNQTATTTPTVAPWLSNEQQGNDALGTWADANWAAFSPEFDSGEQNKALATTNALPSVGSGALSNAVNSAMSLTGQAAPTYTAVAPGAPTTPTASTYGPSGYSPIGDGSTGYTATGTGSTGYGAATTGAAQTGGAGNVNGASISTADIQRLMSPYTTDVVNSTLNNMDLQSGQQQAALKAQAGLNGAFGGSGYGISAAELSAEQGLNRAQEQATLQNDAFNTASGLASQDTVNSQTARLSNQAVQEQTALADAGYRQQTLLANQDAQNAASQFGANAENAADQQTAAAMNAAGQFGAQATNTADLATQQAINEARQFGATQQQSAAAANAGAQNAMSQLGYSGQLQNNQFGAAQQNAASANDQQAQLQSFAQRLQAALGLGGLGSQQFSDANTAANDQASLGQTQYSQDVAKQYTPLTISQLVSNILSGTPTSAYTSTTGTENGTSTTTSSPSFLDQLMELSGIGANAAKMAAAA